MTVRDFYLDTALRQIPRILTLLDTDVTSPSYGCFDREYWHYRTADFPCGMSQEYVLPLALVCKNKLKDNPYYDRQRIKDLVAAGIQFAFRSSHRDGSCDDYFPYERAYGATAFSLYAMTEASMLLALKDEYNEKFLKKRGDWLSNHEESGKLTNHHAVAALGLLKLAQMTEEKKYLDSAREKIDRCLSWQSDEGWFQEYEGCDPGYLSMTVDFLARYYTETKDEKVFRSLEKAVEFLDHFVYPDGTCGGEVGSRDTYIFMPHGFELLSLQIGRAASIKQRYIDGLGHGRAANFEDSRIFGRMTYSHLMAWLDFKEVQPDQDRKSDCSQYFTESRLYVSKKGPYYLACSSGKGGVFKLFRDKDLVLTDTGPVCVFDSGKVGVVNRMAETQVSSQKGIRVKGRFLSVKRRLASPWKQVVFRVMLLTIGRFSSMRDILRKLLQKILITGEKSAPASFERTLALTEDGLDVQDWIFLTGKNSVKKLFISTDKVSIYTAMAECFQSGALLPWIDIYSHVDELNSKRHVRIVRHLK